LWQRAQRFASALCRLIDQSLSLMVSCCLRGGITRAKSARSVRAEQPALDETPRIKKILPEHRLDFLEIVRTTYHHELHEPQFVASLFHTEWSCAPQRPAVGLWCLLSWWDWLVANRHLEASETDLAATHFWRTYRG
jgi:hypothetical protein